MYYSNTFKIFLFFLFFINHKVEAQTYTIKISLQIDGQKINPTKDMYVSIKLDSTIYDNSKLDSIIVINHPKIEVKNIEFFFKYQDYIFKYDKLYNMFKSYNIEVLIFKNQMDKKVKRKGALYEYSLGFIPRVSKEELLNNPTVQLYSSFTTKRKPVYCKF